MPNLCIPWAEVGVEYDDNLSGGPGEGVPQVAGLLQLGDVGSPDVCSRVSNICMHRNSDKCSILVYTHR